MAKAKLLSEGLSEKAIIEKALPLFITVDPEKAIWKLYGKINIDESTCL